jgi:hypothetical protein
MAITEAFGEVRLHARRSPALQEQLSESFPRNRFSSSVLPSVGPVSPQMFAMIEFSIRLFPLAGDPVGDTRNSMPVGFDTT